MNQVRTASENLTCVRSFSDPGEVELLEIIGIASVLLERGVGFSGSRERLNKIIFIKTDAKSQ